MKDFSDFKAYMRGDGSKIHEEIVFAVNEAVDKAKIEDPGEELEFHRRAWVEIGTMKILEAYHNWLHQA